MNIKNKIQDALNSRKRIAEMKKGAEVCDPRPLKIPTGLRAPPTQEQRFTSMMRAHQQQMAQNQAYVDETDFEDEDEHDMLTPYERSALIYEMEPVLPTAEKTPNGVSGREEPSTAAVQEKTEVEAPT